MKRRHFRQRAPGRTSHTPGPLRAANASVGIVLVPHQHFGPGVEYLQSSVYTVVSCAVVFILVATVMVAAICRIHMRRSVMATAFRPPRCLPWCRQLHPPATTVSGFTSTRFCRFLNA